MRVFSTIAEFKEERRYIKGPVGFVPTMGYLHEGHLALVRQARAQNPVVAVSIFVNPTQFGPKEDFAKYPRDTERDLALLEKERVHWVFMPEASEIYPQGFDSWIDAGTVTEKLEGEIRPGHFRGVTTVVAKFFNIIEPTRAYFGQKDAQQALVVKKMVSDLNMNVKVTVAPTVREADGLAMSSRNVYLNPEERKAALVVCRSLELVQQLWSEGERDADSLRQQMIALIQEQPLAVIDYVSIADTETMEELVEVDCPALVSLAVQFGKTRLIDNVILED
ncbi:pantoate--beta-alanine ligase [Chloroflexota bacterium]